MTITLDRAKAEKYIRRLRNPKKRLYAKAYLKFLLGEWRDEPPVPLGLGSMAAQAVRLELISIAKEATS